MVVVLSPNAKASPWVNREISYALELKRDVVPILIDGDIASSVPIDSLKRNLLMRGAPTRLP